MNTSQPSLKIPSLQKFLMLQGKALSGKTRNVLCPIVRNCASSKNPCKSSFSLTKNVRFSDPEKYSLQKPKKKTLFSVSENTCYILWSIVRNCAVSKNPRDWSCSLTKTARYDKVISWSKEAKELSGKMERKYILDEQTLIIDLHTDLFRHCHLNRNYVVCQKQF